MTAFTLPDNVGQFVTDRHPKRQTREENANIASKQDVGEMTISPESDIPSKLKNHIKPATYDGKGPWLDYKSHFDACAKINKWSQEEKGLYLAVSLRGQAQGVLGNLPHSDRQDFDKLANSLEERFSPCNQTELYRAQLRERRQKAMESLPELGQDIRRLANLAYPTAPNDVRETLAKEQFIDALAVSDMRLRIKQARPSDLNDAVRHAVELDAFNTAETKRKENSGFLRSTNVTESSLQNAQLGDLLKSIQSELKSLKDDVKDLKATNKGGQFIPNRNRYGSRQGRPQRPPQGGERTCYACGETGHIIRNCPNKKNTAGDKDETSDRGTSSLTSKKDSWRK